MSCCDELQYFQLNFDLGPVMDMSVPELLAMITHVYLNDDEMRKYSEETGESMQDIKAECEEAILETLKENFQGKSLEELETAFAKIF